MFGAMCQLILVAMMTEKSSIFLKGQVSGQLLGGNAPQDCPAFGGSVLWVGSLSAAGRFVLQLVGVCHVRACCCPTLHFELLPQWWFLVLVSAPASDAFILMLLPCHWEYTWEDSVESIQFIHLVSTSVVFILSWLDRAASLCSSISSVLNFLRSSFNIINNIFLLA